MREREVTLEKKEEFVTDIMGGGVKNFAIVKKNNIHCSRFVHWASNLIIEGWVVGHSFLLHKSILTHPNYYCVLTMVGNGFQEHLIYHLSREYSKADWAVVVWFFLLPFLKTGVTFAFFHYSGNFPHHHDISKMSSLAMPVPLVLKGASCQVSRTWAFPVHLNVS